MQQAIENNLANNELMIAIMVQMHNEYGWGGPADYPPLYVPEQHDELQPGGLAPDDARDEILVVPHEQVFCSTS
jgi:hypothetical protein